MPFIHALVESITIMEAKSKFKLIQVLRGKLSIIDSDLTVFTVQIKTRSPNPKIGHFEFSYIFNDLNICCHKLHLVCRKKPQLYSLTLSRKKENAECTKGRFKEA